MLQGYFMILCEIFNYTIISESKIQPCCMLGVVKEGKKQPSKTSIGRTVQVRSASQPLWIPGCALDC